MSAARPLAISDGLDASLNGASAAVHVDLDRLVAGRLLVQGNSGSGKSRMLRFLLERTAGQIAHLVVDPEGEFYTLRERHPYVLVGRGGDVEPDAATAPALARALAEAGASAVLDVSELAVADRDPFVAAFLRGLVALPLGARRHTLVVVDEAQTVAPEGGQQTAGGAALIDVAMRGRKRGLGLVVATQRLALLSKSLVAQCSNRLVGLTTLGSDQQLAARELGFSAAERGRLRTLSPGEFFAFGPAVSQDVVLVRSGPVETTHPQPGAIAPPTPPAGARLAALVESLRALAPDPEAEPAGGVAGTDGRWKAEADRLRAELGAARRALEAEAARHRELRAGLVSLLGVPVEGVPLALPEASGIRTGRPQRLTSAEMPAGARDAAAPAMVVRARAADRPAVGKLAPPRQRILDALARFGSLGVHAVDRRNLAVFARQSPKSSAYGASLAEMEKGGLLVYPGPGLVALTEAGRAAAHVNGVPASLDELHAEWLGYLPQYQSAILRQMIVEHPRALTRPEVAEATGYSAKSSAFGEALSTLRDLGLVEYPAAGVVRATQLLFPVGLST